MALILQHPPVVKLLIWQTTILLLVGVVFEAGPIGTYCVSPLRSGLSLSPLPRHLVQARRTPSPLKVFPALGSDRVPTMTESAGASSLIGVVSPQFHRVPQLDPMLIHLSL